MRVRRQDRIDHGILIRWTKGFGSPNTEGHNVVEMFRTSLAKHVRSGLLSAFVSPDVIYGVAVRTRGDRRAHVRHDRHDAVLRDELGRVDHVLVGTHARAYQPLILQDLAHGE